MTTLKPEIIISKLVIMTLKLIITTQTQTRNNDLKNSYLQTRNYDFQIHNRDFKLVIMNLLLRQTDRGPMAIIIWIILEKNVPIYILRESALVW